MLVKLTRKGGAKAYQQDIASTDSSVADVAGTVQRYL